jgi:hypothetical protein
MPFAVGKMAGCSTDAGRSWARRWGFGERSELRSGSGYRRWRGTVTAAGSSTWVTGLRLPSGRANSFTEIADMPAPATPGMPNRPASPRQHPERWEGAPVIHSVGLRGPECREGSRAQARRRPPVPLGGGHESVAKLARSARPRSQGGDLRSRHPLRSSHRTRGESVLASPG